MVAHREKQCSTLLREKKQKNKNTDKLQGKCNGTEHGYNFNTLERSGADREEKAENWNIIVIPYVWEQ